jgi:hypothetical protein
MARIIGADSLAFISIDGSTRAPAPRATAGTEVLRCLLHRRLSDRADRLCPPGENRRAVAADR